VLIDLQREIRKKTITYGIAALFLTILLTTVVMNYRVQNTIEPQTPPEAEVPEPPEPSEPTTPTETETPTQPTEPSTPTESTNPTEPTQPTTPTELTNPTEPEPKQEFSNLKTFENKQELELFLFEGIQKAADFQDYPQFDTLLEETRTALPTDSQALASGESTTQYSTTNIQVQGVDEADIIKSDGEFFYIVSGTTIYITKAYPPNEAQLLSKIELNQTYGAQIYVNEDKLVILGNQNWLYTYGFIEEDVTVRTEAMSIYPYYAEESYVKVYDITDRAAPKLTRTLTVNGTYSGSRMIQDYVYFVVNQPIINEYSDKPELDIILPTISGDQVKEIQPNEIRYIDTLDYNYRLTNIIAINIKDDSAEPTWEAFLASHTTNMYVSQNNMYLVVPNTNLWITPSSNEEPRDETLIYRIKLENERITVMAEGSITGYVLNQYSMDEYNNHFRVATTEWQTDGSINNLFIMDMDMNVVGKIQKLAPGERIYSARFLEEKCYLVTFRQIDPFYVIDVSNPNEPKILGYLKIPGFSGYLHPYDQNHIIGIGKEETNIKLSLFDVTDVSNPIEKAKYIINADWSDSPILWDSKALLFEKSKQLLAIPVTINQYRTLVPGTYWQGAYIFNISLEGFTLKGDITHRNPENQYEYNLEVKRILYIEDVLYTVSDKIIKMNDLQTLNYIKQIELY
jgi:inhibitor of cysteine peptidase